MGPEILGLGLGLGQTLIQQQSQDARQSQTMKNQRELMRLQKQNQMALNTQGYKFQQQMWKDTNFPAQLKMMKEAGLNPALMYGMGGSGGTTTGSQSGGSAQGGTAPQPQQLDIRAIMDGIANVIQMAKTKEETKNITEERQNIPLKGENIEADTELKEAQKQTEVQRSGLVMQQGIKEAEEVVRLSRENRIGTETEKDIIKSIGLRVALSEVEIKAKEMQINLNAEQIRQIQHRIWQEWVKAGSLAIGSIGVVASKVLTAFKKDNLDKS